jgi:hypothetical protein
MNIAHFLTHDEDCVPDEVTWSWGGRRPEIVDGEFTCAGCRQRRPNSEGGADDTVLGMACDDCVVATRAVLQTMGRAIALRGRR